MREGYAERRAQTALDEDLTFYRDMMQNRLITSNLQQQCDNTSFISGAGRYQADDAKSMKQIEMSKRKKTIAKQKSDISTSKISKRLFEASKKAQIQENLTEIQFT